MDFRPVLASAAALASVMVPLSGHAQTAVPQQVCRNVSQTITIDGQPQQAVTFMCQQPDGSWAPAPAASTAATAPQAAYPPAVQAAYVGPDYYDPYYAYYGPGWGYYPSGGVFIGGIGGHFGGHFGGHGGGHGFHGHH